MSLPRTAAIAVALALLGAGAFLYMRSRRDAQPPPAPAPATTLLALRPISADRALAVRTGAEGRHRVESVTPGGEAQWSTELPAASIPTGWIQVPDARGPAGDLVLVRVHGPEAEEHTFAQGLAAFARAGGELRWTAELPPFSGLSGYHTRAPLDLPWRPIDGAVAPGVILATADDGRDRWVLGIAPGDGAVKWKQPVDPHAAEPTPVGRWLVLTSRPGKVFVNTDSGEAVRAEDVSSGCELDGNYLAVVTGGEGGRRGLVELAGGDPAQRKAIKPTRRSLFDDDPDADLLGCGKHGAERVLVVDDGAPGSRVVVLDEQGQIARTIRIDRATCDFDQAPAPAGRLAIEGELPRFALCAIDRTQTRPDLLGSSGEADREELVPHLAMLDLEQGRAAWESPEIEMGLVMRAGLRWYHLASSPAGLIVMVFDGTTGQLAAAAEVVGGDGVERRPDIIADGALWLFLPGDDAGRPARIAVLDAATLAPRSAGGVEVRDQTAELRSKLRPAP